MFSTNDTIVAVSSAAGPAGRSIVRMSGPDAIGVAKGVFSGSLGELGGFQSLDGTVALQVPWPITVPARAYLFRGPRSYTRQDIVELHLPGEVVASVVCSAMIDAGARQADAGEFTARAFLSGRLDLSAAQAVADVIDAQADAQLRSAVGVLDGALARLCRPAAETLTETLAVTEASIDFADEDLDLAVPVELASTTRKVADDLDVALSTSGRWSAAESEIRVAIAGRPNAGKSSLLNALGGVDRAIISALSGTTRDVLSTPATLVRNLEVMLLDAAGLEAFAENHDPLTLAAHRAAREAIRSADAVLFVIDVSSDDHDADERLLDEVVELNARAPLLILANKIDLCNSTDKSRQLSDHSTPVVPGMSEANLPETPHNSSIESCISNARQDRPEGPKEFSRGRKPPVGMPPLTKPRRGERTLFAKDSVAPPGLDGPGMMSGGLRPRLNSAAPSGPNEILRRFDKDVFPISAMTGAGLDNLRRVLADRLDSSAAPKPGTLLLHENQRRGISTAAAAARQAAGMFQTAGEITDVAELAAIELRSALASLAELTGQVADEDVLSSIFSRFCVGK